MPARGEGRDAKPGGRADAVIREPVAVERGGPRVEYSGERWSLAVDGGAEWRQEADPESTLRLVRDANGGRLVLRLRAYRVREGMTARTFLGAHAMWIAEERGPRIEYTWDADLGAWHGYAVSSDYEVYYLFRVGGDRGYGLEESAEAGALDADAAAEFARIGKTLEVKVVNGPPHEPQPDEPPVQ